mmetsp:Transcript_26150/g.102517  ORF Transcript_26150/g.102517 Transcript_26150/m.102517 type:complete len:101 (-) Transcript_26150:2908-3210(-)
MSGIWAAYNARLAAKPLQTKTLTSFTGFILGDLVAQAPDLAAGKPWDSWRTTKLAAFGLFLHGPIGHYWYGFLDRVGSLGLIIRDFLVQREDRVQEPSKR